MLGKGLPFKTALVVGGDPMPQQFYRIKHGVELIVGTPGRLIDLLTKHDIDLQVLFKTLISGIEFEDEYVCRIIFSVRDGRVRRGSSRVVHFSVP